MGELTEQQLLKLYFKFVTYRDAECGGLARMSVADFYKRFGIDE